MRWAGTQTASKAAQWPHSVSAPERDHLSGHQENSDLVPTVNGLCWWFLFLASSINETNFVYVCVCEALPNDTLLQINKRRACCVCVWKMLAESVLCFHEIRTCTNPLQIRFIEVHCSQTLTWVHKVVSTILQPWGNVVILAPQVNKHLVADYLHEVTRLS